MTEFFKEILVLEQLFFHISVRGLFIDDDRWPLTSDVTAYVNKNQYRVVQFPFKA